MLAIQQADYLQQAAVAHIQDTFKTETDEVDLRTMTYGDFIKALEVADKNGTREEFEARLAAQLMPTIQQIMSMGQEQPSGNSQP
jgi:hypothetical protein